MPDSLTGPLSRGELYHTGFVVDDLAAAQAALGPLLGVTWLTGGGTVEITTPDGSSVVETSYALSAEGPHHVELVQAVAGTLYVTSGPAAAHHLGYWVEDVARVSAELEASGLAMAASVGAPGGRRPMAAYHRTGAGLYIEVVARSMRKILFPTLTDITTSN